MSTCLAFCAAAAPPAVVWGWTPLVVGVGIAAIGLILNAGGLILAALGTRWARADSQEARQRQAVAEERERAATERELDQSRRQQAGKVAAWTGIEWGSDAPWQWHHSYIKMANLSDLPVTQVRVVVILMTLTATIGPRRQGNVRPGFVPSEVTRTISRETLGPGETWQELLDDFTSVEDGRDFLVRSTAFVDAEGQNWIRDKVGLRLAAGDDRAGAHDDPEPAVREETS